MTDVQDQEARNKAILRAVFDETAQGNGRAFYDVLAPDVRWTIIGTTAWSGTYAGKADVASRLLGPLAENFDGRNTVSAQRILADGDVVVAEARNHSTTRAGVSYPNRYCWIMVMRDGLVIEITEYADTALIDRVLSKPAPSSG